MQPSTELLALIGAVVIGLVEAAKQAGLETRYAPLLSGAVGLIVGGAVLVTAGVPVPTALVYGLLAGLGATGSYAVVSRVGQRA